MIYKIKKIQLPYKQKKELIDLLIAKQREMNFDETDIRVASNFEIQGMIESVTNPETTALQKFNL